MKKKHKILVVLSTLSVLAATAITATGFSGSSGLFARILKTAPKTTGSWVHYATKQPTATEKGVREYWVQCGGQGYQFEAPQGVTPDDSEVYDTSEFATNDERWIPSLNEINSKISSLGTDPQVMKVNKLKEIQKDLNYLSQENLLNVTNLTAFNSLADATNNMATSIIGPTVNGTSLVNYNNTITAQTVADDLFGKTYKISGEAGWTTHRFDLSGFNASNYEDVGVLAIYLKADTTNKISLDVVDEWNPSGGGAPHSYGAKDPSSTFVNKLSNATESTTSPMFETVFGNRKGWRLLVLNAAHTRFVLNTIEEKGYFAFKVTSQLPSDTFEISDLFGYKDMVFEEGTKLMRRFSNGYSSGEPAGSVTKDNSRFNPITNFNDAYDNSNISYCNAFKNVSNNPVYTVLYNITVPVYTANNELLKAWMYVYSSMETKAQFAFSGQYTNIINVKKGINRLDLTKAQMLALNGEGEKTILAVFKSDDSKTPSLFAGQVFEIVSGVYAIYDEPTVESVIEAIDLIPDSPKAMNLEAVNIAASRFNKLAIEDQSKVTNVSKLENALTLTSNYVSLVTPYTKDGKFEKFNGDVTLGNNASDPVFGEVFTVSDASAEFGQWRTFRFSSTTLDSAVLDQIGMLGIYVKTTGENHNYISLDAIIWNSKGGPTKINTAQIDGARFANKNNSYDGKSIINYPIYQETFGNPGNGWELCTISAQYTKTIINELKENGEISFASSSKLCDANGSFYVAGLFGIKANGTMPTEDLKAAYCFANGWESIDNSATGMTKDSSHGRVDPTFNRCVWPTGPAGDKDGVRLDHVYYTFKNTNASDVDPLSGAIVYDKGATVDTSKSWSALYVYIYVKYETKVQISICGTYNNNYVTLNAGLNLVKLSNADIAVLKAKEGTADENSGNFKMGVAFRQGAKIPSGQIIYITGIFGLPAAE